MTDDITAQPLPKEIAGLIDEAAAIIPYWPTHEDLLKRLVTALRSLAQSLRASEELKWDYIDQCQALARENGRPKQIDNWHGKPIASLTRGEFIDALSWCVERQAKLLTESLEAKAKLRALAQKNETRVSVELLNIERETCDRIRSDNDNLRQRIRELKDECDRLTTVIIETQDRCDAIRRKTIEECAKWLEDMPEHWRTLARDIRRAFVKTEPGEEK